MKKLLIGAALLLTGTAAAAQLAPAPRAPGQGDGIQTRAEVVERVRTMFGRVDANRDGSITRDEGQALRGKARGRRMAQGGAMRQADPARRAQMFERLDANRDNVISRDEWARAEALRGQARAGGQRMGRGGARMAMRGRMGGAMLRQADVNNDQRITLQEAETAALRRFDQADRNRDGRVTREERQQVRQLRRQQRQGQLRG